MGQYTITGHDLDSYRLRTDNRLLAQLFDRVRDTLRDTGGGFLILSRMPAGVGGFLGRGDSGEWYLSLRKSMVSSDIVTVRRNSIAMLIHELGHFLHLVVAGGRYTTIPSLTGCVFQDSDYSTQGGRLASELEAWGISRILDGQLSLGMLDEIDKVNSRNMLYSSMLTGLLTNDATRRLTSLPSYEDWLDIVTGKRI